MTNNNILTTGSLSQAHTDSTLLVNTLKIIRPLKEVCIQFSSSIFFSIKFFVYKNHSYLYNDCKIHEYSYSACKYFYDDIFVQLKHYPQYLKLVI